MARSVAGTARSSLARLLATRAATRVSQAVAGDAVTIFVLHRVVPTELLEGNDLRNVLAIVDRLRAAGHHLVSLEAVAARWNGGPPLPRGAVAFTADDGYLDQAERLGPAFEGRECPLTIFLATGFLDRTWVPWWDVLEHAVATTDATDLDLEIGGQRLMSPLRTAEDKRHAAYALADAYKRCPTLEAEEAVDQVCAQLGVARPDAPFGPYQPMSWDQARALESGGVVRFGPHTVTHPVLARAPADQVDAEVRTSWRRLEEEMAHPLPVFCYPVGEDGDHGEREYRAVAGAGLQAAVTVGRRHARLDRRRDDLGRFRLDRIPLWDDEASAVFAATGLTRVRDRLRSVRR